MISGLGILAFIIALLIALSFHELGHYLVARLFKVRILEFSIGIGPKLCGFRIKNSQYNLRLFLLGAYVQMDSNRLRKLYKDLMEEERKENWFKQEIADLSWTNYVSKMFGSDDTWFYWRNYFRYRGFKKRMVKTNLVKDKYFMYDEVSNWKKLLICLAGVFFNLILVVIILMIFIIGVGLVPDDIWGYIKSFYERLGEIFIWKEPVSSGIGGGGEAPFWLILSNLLLNINFSLLLLNILPIPPLDGFKVLTIGWSSVFKKDVPEKVEIWLQIIGSLLMLYLTMSSIIQMFIYK